MVATSAVLAVTTPVLIAAQAGFYHVSRRYYLYGSAFVTLQWGGHAIAALYSAGLAIATVLFYRQRAVRRLFARG